MASLQVSLQRLWRNPAVREGFLAFVIMRLLTAVIVALAGVASPTKVDWSLMPIYAIHDQVVSLQGPLRAWIEPWYRWDTGWYIKIAYNGYSSHDGSIIFPPLYPWLIRLLAPLTLGDYLVAALIISSICAFVSLVLLYKLVGEEHSASTARTTLLLFVLYPASYYLFAAYTESLFLMLTLSAWLLARRAHYGWAGGLAFLASLARTQGWTLGLSFAWMAYVAPHSNVGSAIKHYLRHPLEARHALPAVIGGPLGAALYLFGMTYLGYGSVSANFEGELWKTRVTTPWNSIISAVKVLSGQAGRPLLANDILNVASFLFVVILAVVMLKMLKVEYSLYVWSTLLFVLLRSTENAVFHGILRYAVSMFPIFIVLALLLNHPGALAHLTRLCYMVVGAMLQALLMIMFAWWLFVS